MPVIRPISDLENNSDEISEFCRASREPVFITKDGVSDMVVLNIETYERQRAQLELYAKLAEAQAAIEAGDEGKDFFAVAKEIRERLIVKLRERVQYI
jgi:PHD/YefM family antitoxin component YafN of YafNO toxin-antitoxin module